MTPTFFNFLPAVISSEQDQIFPDDVNVSLEGKSENAANTIKVRVLKSLGAFYSLITSGCEWDHIIFDRGVCVSHGGHNWGSVLRQTGHYGAESWSNPQS